MNNLHLPTWDAVKALLEADRADKLESLVREDNEQTRGAIKFIDEVLLRYPIELSKEN